jgi:hypothetical protein
VSHKPLFVAIIHKYWSYLDGLYIFSCLELAAFEYYFPFTVGFDVEGVVAIARVAAYAVT